ncbi:MAG: hypothetical protein LBQ70_05365 [Prevotellaceae bacterium]|jgi:hypothetical protein|nr:hypothetical protein [Prevotellaceae bacterium]
MKQCTTKIPSLSRAALRLRSAVVTDPAVAIADTRHVAYPRRHVNSGSGLMLITTYKRSTCVAQRGITTMIFLFQMPIDDKVYQYFFSVLFDVSKKVINFASSNKAGLL